MATVINTNGKEINFESAIQMMDDDLREKLADEGHETDQDFFSAYEIAHQQKFGADWELSKSNPVW